jgi:hypothetical protein
MDQHSPAKHPPIGAPARRSPKGGVRVSAGIVPRMNPTVRDPSSSDTDCQNCGSTGLPTEPVQRVYCSPESPSDLDAATIDNEIEVWCAACVANYPHLAVKPG